MTLITGARLGPYEIVALLGVGGMGEVFRARDTKLNRDVAIKVLLSGANDPDRLARFSREAQLLASLNHPNIAHIHGLEETGGVTALVLELVEGEDLAQRIGRGPVPIDEALPIAKQIAEALEAAHEQGIIHRDLKPANIKVRADGTVKVLDFGLAKLSEAPGDSPRSGIVTQSPTLTSPVGMTAVGMILGTAAYMSPEQAKGRVADKRCDVWAFGCVLYEMLTRRRPFASDDVTEVLAFVITQEPDWSALPAGTPASVRKLLRRCLEKDPRRRLRDIGDALPELAEAASQDVPAMASVPPRASPPPARRGFEHAVTAGVLVASCVATGIVVWRAKPSPPAVVTRFVLNLPPDQQLTGSLGRIVAFSPDGTRLAYVANNRLYVRAMAENDARPVAGTDAVTVRGGLMFAWSPDSRYIAYVADGTIRKISMDGGGATTICSFEQRDDPGGGVMNTTFLSWGPAGIVFVGRNAIMRVGADGGTPERMAAVDDSKERAQDPQMLPDGRTLLFGVAPTAEVLMDFWNNADIVVQSTPSGERRVVTHGATSPRYIPTGHLLYASGGTVLAAPFNAARQQLTGPPVAMLEGVRRSVSTSISQFSVADNGSLAYAPGPVGSANESRPELVLLNLKGEASRLLLPQGPSYEFPRYSPDGSSVTFDAQDGKDSDVWVYRLSGDSAMRRLTFGGHNRHPIWSRDGQWITFQSDREGDFGLFRQRADGSGVAERLTKPETGTAHVPQSWSANGELLLFASDTGGVLNARTGANNPGATSALRLLTMKDRRSTPVADVQSRDRDVNAEFSPDDAWIAYSAGVKPSVVYVRPFPLTGTVYQISKNDDGHHPFWSRDGRGLFYVPGPDGLSKVSVTTRPAFSFSNPVALPRGSLSESPVTSRNMDVSPDGAHILGAAAANAGAGDPRFLIVLNWFDELKQRVPTK